MVEGVDRRGGHKFLTEGNEENKASEVAMLQPSGCSNDLAAEVVRFLVCWMHEEEFLQKATPNAFASKLRKQRFDLRLKNQPFIYFY
jgi:hypothetical protein